MTTGGGRMYRSKCAVEAIWPLEESEKVQGTWRCRKGLVTYRAIGRAVWTMTRTTGGSSSSLNREIDTASEMVHDAPECVAVGVYVRGESTPEPPNCSRSFRARLACASRVRVSRACLACVSRASVRLARVSVSVYVSGSVSVSVCVSVSIFVSVSVSVSVAVSVSLSLSLSISVSVQKHA